MNTLLRVAGVAGLTVIGTALQADAAFMPWSQPSGMTSTFTYSGGGSDNGLFGSPDVVTPSGFAFTPDGFIASDDSDDGIAMSASDRLEVTITAKPGLSLDSISISELGDYAILGAGSVQVTGALFVVGPDIPLTGLSDLLSTNPSMPVSTPGAGLYDGVVMIDLPAGVSQVTLVYNNTVQADSDGGSALIQKKTAGLFIDIETNVPEPTSLAFAAFAAPLLMRRRR